MRAIVRSLTGRPFRRAGREFPAEGVEVDLDALGPIAVEAILAEPRLRVEVRGEAAQPSQRPEGGAPQGSAATTGDLGASATLVEPERDAEGRVRINLASAETLRSVRGIGPQLADAIVARRQNVGPFASVDDLVGLPGIGKRNLAALAEQVTCT